MSDKDRIAELEAQLGKAITEIQRLRPLVMECSMDGFKLGLEAGDRDNDQLRAERDRLEEEIKAFHSLVDWAREEFEQFKDGVPIELIAVDAVMDDPVGCIEWAHNINGDFTLKDKLTYEDALRLRYQDVPALEKIVGDVAKEAREAFQAQDGVLHDERPGGK